MNKTVSLGIALITTCVLTTQISSLAFAQSFPGSGLINEVTAMQNRAASVSARQATALANLIQRADKLITDRTTALNTLLSRIGNDSQLSASEKVSLQTEVQAEISGLATLKTKIDADADLVTTRSDTKQIITGYYVFAVFEPKIRLLITLNNLEVIVSNVQGLVPQIQALVTNFKSQGKDVTQLQAALDDISSQLTTTSTTITSDISKVEAVSVTDGPTVANSVYVQVRQDIAQVVRQGLAKIRSDFATMRQLFHQLILGNGEAPNVAGQAVAPSNPPARTGLTNPNQ